MYVYELKEKIKEVFNFEFVIVSFYVVFYKFEKEGYVILEWQEMIGGKLVRKYYKFILKGEEFLKEGINFFEEILKKLKGE